MVEYIYYSAGLRRCGGTNQKSAIELVNAILADRREEIWGKGFAKSGGR
jgi:hypothetical protein